LQVIVLAPGDVGNTGEESVPDFEVPDEEPRQRSAAQDLDTPNVVAQALRQTEPRSPWIRREECDLFVEEHWVRKTLLFDVLPPPPQILAPSEFFSGSAFLVQNLIYY
jgi:hypothetical protein